MTSNSPPSMAAAVPFAMHFANMFKIGLLGYVGMHLDRRAGPVFPLSGRGSARPQRRTARRRAARASGPPQPRSPDRRLQPDYFRHLDKLNVIGADRPWRSARQTQFVLKGDVRG